MELDLGLDPGHDFGLSMEPGLELDLGHDFAGGNPPPASGDIPVGGLDGSIYITRLPAPPAGFPV